MLREVFVFSSRFFICWACLIEEDSSATRTCLGSVTAMMRHRYNHKSNATRTRLERDSNTTRTRLEENGYWLEDDSNKMTKTSCNFLIILKTSDCRLRTPKILESSLDDLPICSNLNLVLVLGSKSDNSPSVIRHIPYKSRYLLLVTPLKRDYTEILPRHYWIARQ